MIRAQISKLCTICSENYLSFFRLEKAAAKLPKKDIPAVKKRFAFLEVSCGVVLRVICSCCDECCVHKQASLVDHNQASFGLFLPCFIISMNACPALPKYQAKPSQAEPFSVGSSTVTAGNSMWASGLPFEQIGWSVCMLMNDLQEDVRSIEAGSIPMPKYANSQAAFYAVQQAPPPKQIDFMWCWLGQSKHLMLSTDIVL